MMGRPSLSSLCAAISLSVFFSLATSPASAEITHSFLGLGKANQAVIVAEDDTVQWKFEKPASDGWVLPSGNVLLALYPTEGFPGGGVVEVDRETKQIVSQYKGQQKEISTVQPLPDGKYLVAELGPNPRALVINRQGKVVSTTPFQCQKRGFHMQTGMLRMLPNGLRMLPNGLYEVTESMIVRLLLTTFA